MEKLEELRKKIDRCDDKIVKALEWRIIVCREIGLYKKVRGIQVEDKKREKQLINRIAAKTNLNNKFIKDLYSVIIKESKKCQK